MVKFQGKNWHLIVTRNLSLFHSCLDNAGNYSCAKKYGLPPNCHIAISKNGRLGYIFANKEITKRYRKELEKICLDKDKFKKLESVYYEFGDKLWNSSEALEKNLNITSFKNFINAYKDLATGLVITTHIGRHMPVLLTNRLQKYYPKISKQELDILIGDITYPDKSTPLIESQLLLLKIGEELQKKKLSINKIKNNSKIYKIFKNYTKKYD